MTVIQIAAAQFALVFFPLLMVFAGAGDVMTARIPNYFPVAMSVVFFPIALATGMPLLFFGLHIATAIVLLLVGYGLFSFGFIGGGDAKLMAAAGLWLGFPSALPFMLFSVLAGGVLAAAIGLLFMLNMEAGMRSVSLDKALSRFKPSVPYGFALSAGAILAIPFTWWMRVGAG